MHEIIIFQLHDKLLVSIPHEKFSQFWQFFYDGANFFIFFYFQKDEVDGKNTKKDISLLSIFCPPLGGSVWTTVALLIGWGLISRTR